MEKQARFYISQSHHTQVRYEITYNLCKKALEGAKKVGLICADEDMLQALDLFLWEKEACFFLPHTRLGDPLEAKAAVVLYCYPERIANADIIINLGFENDIDLPKDCHKVFEVVNQEPAVLQITRNRYRKYQQLSFSIETATINPSSTNKKGNHDED